MSDIFTESLIEELEHSLSFLLRSHKGDLNTAFDDAVTDADEKNVKFRGFKVTLSCILYPGDASDTIEASLGIRYLPQPAKSDRVEIVHRSNQEGLFTHKGEPTGITGIKFTNNKTGESVLLGSDKEATVPTP